MTRRVAVIVLLVLLGAGVAVSLWPGGKSSEGGPDRYAQIDESGHELDVWRDPHGRLTFRWKEDTPGEESRYSPSSLTMTRIVSDRYEIARTIFVSRRSAWHTIRAWYGVTEPQLTHALESGTTSGPAPGSHAYPPRTAKGRRKFVTDYGTALARAAAASGLVLPRLKALDGFRFFDAASVPGGAALSFGRPRSGSPAITLNIARYDPEHPGAMGTVNKQMYDSSKWPHHRADGVRYMEVAGDIVFPYRSEWVAVGPQVTPTRGGWAKLIRAILAAPTTG